MKHQITLAQTAGFCFGVDRAVKLVYGLVEQFSTLKPYIKVQYSAPFLPLT